MWCGPGETDSSLYDTLCSGGPPEVSGFPSEVPVCIPPEKLLLPKATHFISGGLRLLEMSSLCCIEIHLKNPPTPWGTQGSASSFPWQPSELEDQEQGSSMASPLHLTFSSPFCCPLPTPPFFPEHVGQECLHGRWASSGPAGKSV